MPKSQIIKDIVEDNVSLEKSLTRLLVLAKDIKNKKLESWAENELNGYKTADDVPEYRKFKSCELRYSGINGGFQVKNVPLSNGWIDKKYLDIISNISICDGIRYVCELANSDTIPVRKVTELAGAIYKASDGGITCTSVEQIISQSFYQIICSSVKNKMITALCELENKYGVLDNLGIDVSNKKSIQIEADNNKLNKAVFNINVPMEVSSSKKVPWYSKIAWNIVVPIITAIAGAVISAIFISYIGV